MAIKEYDFTIKCCKASENKIADTLSRYSPIVHESFTSKNTEMQILSVQCHLPNQLNSTLNKHKYRTKKRRKFD